jgi:hypothetical protein
MCLFIVFVLALVLYTCDAKVTASSPAYKQEGMPGHHKPGHERRKKVLETTLQFQSQNNNGVCAKLKNNMKDSEAVTNPYEA